MKTGIALAGLLAVAAIGAAGEDRMLVFGVNRVANDEVLYHPPDFSEQVYQCVQALGGTMVRLAASPRDIEPERGKRSWDEYDQDLELATRYGLEPMVCVVNTPGWANKTGKPCHDHPYLDKFLPDFEAFCRELAQRSKGRVRLYQIWNEPNGCGWHFYDGWNHYDEYVPMLRAAYHGLKQGDPGCQVLIGGLDDAGGNAHYFLRGIYEIRDQKYPGERFFDGLTDHPYSHDLSTMHKKMETLRAILAEHGDENLPLFITEYGWTAGEAGLESQGQRVKEFLAAFTTPEWSFLRGAIYLSLSDFAGMWDGFGIVDSNLRPRPAGYAFQGAERSGVYPPYKISWRPLSATSVAVLWETLQLTAGSLSWVRAGAPQDSGTLGLSASSLQHRVVLEELQPDSAYEFVAHSAEPPEEPARSRARSASYTFRTPGPQVYNGGFAAGFYGGVADGWRSRGEGFLTDAALLPDVGALKGRPGQALYAFLEKGMKLDATLWTFIAPALGKRQTVHARWAGGVYLSSSSDTLHLRLENAELSHGVTLQSLAEEHLPLSARLGVDPHGGEDPTAPGMVWTLWQRPTTQPEEVALSFEPTGPVATVFVQCQCPKSKVKVMDGTGIRPTLLVQEVRMDE